MKTPTWLYDERLGVVAAVSATALLTAVLLPLRPGLTLLNVGLLLLLLTLATAAIWGVRVGMLTAAITNLSLNFFFVPPFHKFEVEDASNAVALVVFLVVSLVAGSLVSAARTSAERARLRQAESDILLQLSRALIGRTDPGAALIALCDLAVSSLSARAATVLGAGPAGWMVLANSGDETASRELDPEERSIADRVLSSGRLEGVGFSGLAHTRRPRLVLPRGFSDPPRTSVTFVPLRIGERPLGVLRLDGPLGDTIVRREPERLLTAFAQEASLSVQRLELAGAAAESEALRRADEMKTALMHSISHDLKTPLAGIKAAVSALLDEKVSWSEEDRAAFLATIESQTDRLDQLISDILDLNRLKSGSIAIRREEIDVVDLLDEAVASATVGHKIEVHACEAVISIDATLVRQILVNLLSNAAKYSPTDDPIEVSAEVTGACLKLVVADQGPGIEEEDLPHVFEPFYRSERDRTKQGTGIGLAIVKGFAELLGGSATVENTGTGCSFAVSLPVGEPDHAVKA